MAADLDQLTHPLDAGDAPAELDPDTAAGEHWLTASVLTEYLGELLLTLPADLDAGGGDLVDFAAIAGHPRLLELLRILECARKRLQELENEVEATLVRVLPKRTTIDGLGTFEVMPGGRRKSWDADRLVPIVLRHALAGDVLNPETGEVLKPDALEAATTAVAALCEAARLEWRSTPLKAWGLNPDAYSEVERGRRTIKRTWAQPTDRDGTASDAGDDDAVGE